MARFARIAGWVVAASLAAAAHGEDIRWRSDGGGRWHAPMNWMPPRVPGPADRAIFDRPLTYTITTDGAPAQVQALVLAAGQPTIDLGGTAITMDEVVLGASGTLTLSDGPIESGDGLAVVGPPGGEGTLRFLRSSCVASKLDATGGRLHVDAGSAVGGTSTVTLTDASLVVSAPGAQLVGGVLTTTLTRTEILVTGGASFDGDTLIFDDGSHVEYADGATGAWIALSGGALTVRTGASVSVTECGSAAYPLLLSGAGSWADLSDGYAIVSNGAVLAPSCGWRGEALVGGSGSAIATPLVLGRVELLAGGALLGQDGYLDVSGDVLGTEPGATIAADLVEVWGSIDLRSGASVEAQMMSQWAGRIVGEGQVRADLDQHGGALAPAGSDLNVEGAYAQPTADAELEITIGPGNSPNLSAASAVLAGGLRVVLADGFIPSAGHEYPIVEAASIGGVFDPARLSLPDLPAGRGWSLTYGPDAVTLSVTGCAADADGDGTLTAHDFAAFRALFQAGDDAADLNGDGSCTLADLAAFRAAFLAGCG